MSGGLTPERAKQLQALSAAARRNGRPLTLEAVEQQLGALDGPTDAQRWAKQTILWAAAGLLPGVVANSIASLLREWAKSYDLQHLTSRLRELEDQLATLERGRLPRLTDDTRLVLTDKAVQHLETGCPLPPGHAGPCAEQPAEPPPGGER